MAFFPGFSWEVVLEAADPHVKAYQLASPPVTFSLREQEGMIELVAVRKCATRRWSVRIGWLPPDRC
jgi:hypothetical protein